MSSGIEKPFDVLVVGELNVDIIMNGIGKHPEIGKEVLASHLNFTLGSASAIFACNLSTLGSSVVFVGTIGEDYFGDNLISSLAAKGVDTQHVVRLKDQRTGATVVLVLDGDNAMVTYPGSMNYLTIAHISDEAIRQARHLHLSSVFLLPALMPDVVTLFKKAKSYGLTTSMDPQWDPAEQWHLPLDMLLPYVDVFMPNVAELCALTGTASVQDGISVLKSMGNVVVVKNSSDGAWLWDGCELAHQPSFLNRAVVDSVGAGDSFNAGFIHQYIRQRPLRECVAFGALTGAINTTRPGGTGAFETLNLVKDIARSMFNYEL